MCPLATLTSYPWTKLVVPSTGSMIHVGLSVKMHGSPFATDSSPMKLQHRTSDGVTSRSDKQHAEKGSCVGVCLRASHQCVPSPNSCFRDPMMIFSTLSSVLVTRSTVELFVMTLISLSPAFLISYTDGILLRLIYGIFWLENPKILKFYQKLQTPGSTYGVHLEAITDDSYVLLQLFLPLQQQSHTPSAMGQPWCLYWGLTEESL